MLEQDAGSAAATSVESLMPRLKAALAQLVAIPSVSAPGFPESTHGPLLEAYEAVAELFRDAGVQNVQPLELPETAPVVTGEIPAPDGAPTVLLYSHYDVVGEGDESKWESPPFEATERDGAIFGRGSADTKSNILSHVGALRAWEGRPPVGIRLVIEGQEEVGSALNTYPLENPGPFRSDAMVIADMGSMRPGVPTLTVALRGTAVATVEVTTLAGPKHSGQYGGAAPDALIVLLRALASLHDEHGDVAVEGLRREEWTGESQSEDELRELAEVRDGVPLIGSVRLTARRRRARLTSGDARPALKPVISRHLKVLEETGVVTRVIEGRTHRLSLDTHALGEAADCSRCSPLPRRRGC